MNAYLEPARIRSKGHGPSTWTSHQRLPSKACIGHVFRNITMATVLPVTQQPHRRPSLTALCDESTIPKPGARVVKFDQGNYFHNLAVWLHRELDGQSRVSVCGNEEVFLYPADEFLPILHGRAAQSEAA